MYELTSNKISQNEKEIAKKIISEEKSLHEDSFYINSYERNKGLEKYLQRGELFACIGSGALPSTLLYVESLKLYDRLIGIDIDQAAITYAEGLCHLFGKKNIEFHTSLDFFKGEINAVFIANHVRPKLGTLKSVEARLHKNALVIVREPLGKSSTESIKEELPSSWRLIAEVSRSELFNSYNLLLEKNI